MFNKQIQDLTHEQCQMMLDDLHDFMYAERDHAREAEEPNIVALSLNPDKEVNGGDLVDLVSDWFRRLDVVPD